MKNLLRAMVDQREHLLQQAIIVDREDKLGSKMFDHISELLPSSFKRTISKSEIVDIFVGVWRVLIMILKHPSVKLGILPQDRLDPYIWMMEDTWDLCESLIMTEKISDNNSKPMKIPKNEMNRAYNGNCKPPSPFHICPKCLEPFVHEAVGNEDVRKENRAKTKEYQRALKANKDSDLIIPKPKEKPELLICAAHSLRHSFARKGYSCNDCSDRSCKLCSNNCQFVFSKTNYTSKRAHFENLRKKDDAIEQSGRAKCDAYLDRAARYRNEIVQLERERLDDEEKRTGYRGHEESTELYVQRFGAEKQARYILENPLQADGAKHLRNVINKASDPRGPTFSKKYGDMRVIGNSASKQRGANTGLSNAKKLHHRKQDRERESLHRTRKKPRLSDSSKDDDLDNTVVLDCSDNDTISVHHSAPPPSRCKEQVVATSSKAAKAGGNEGIVLTQPEISEVRDQIFGEFTFDTPDAERIDALNAMLDDIGNHDKEIELANKYLCSSNVKPKDRLECLLKLKEALSSTAEHINEATPVPNCSVTTVTSPEFEELREQIYEEIMLEDPDDERRNELVVLFLAVKKQCPEITRVDKYLCSQNIVIKPKERVDGLISFQKACACAHASR